MPEGMSQTTLSYIRAEPTVAEHYLLIMCCVKMKLRSRELDVKIASGVLPSFVCVVAKHGVPHGYLSRCVQLERLGADLADRSAGQWCRTCIGRTRRDALRR